MKRTVRTLGAQLPPPIAIPGLEDEGRALLVARQRRPCPPQYPRAGGAPQKRPLGG